MKQCFYPYQLLLWVPIITLFHPVYSSNTSSKQLTHHTESTQPINQHLQRIIDIFNTLPTKFQPVDLKQSLLFILQGNNVWRHLQKNNLFDALALQNPTAEFAKIATTALNSSDDVFWTHVHNDPEVKRDIEMCNIAFNRDSSISHEYKMLFRMTYIKAHVTDAAQLEQFTQAYENAIIALQWFIYAQALLQDRPFISAMITLPDHEYTLFHFFDGYCELVSPRYRFYSAMHPHSLWQCHAYKRFSRHWKHKKDFDNTAFGIDMINQANILPGNMSHILFGRLDNGLLFVTWQQHGITLNFKSKNFSALKHPIDALKRHHHDASLYRNEKVSEDVAHQFKSLHKQTLTKDQSYNVSRDGISAMLSLLEHDTKKMFEKYLKEFKKYNPFTLQYRKGDEVVLLPKKFVNFYAPNSK